MWRYGIIPHSHTHTLTHDPLPSPLAEHPLPCTLPSRTRRLLPPPLSEQRASLFPPRRPPSLSDQPSQSTLLLARVSLTVELDEPLARLGGGGKGLLRENLRAARGRGGVGVGSQSRGRKAGNGHKEQRGSSVAHGCQTARFGGEKMAKVDVLLLFCSPPGESSPEVVAVVV